MPPKTRSMVRRRRIDTSSRYDAPFPIYNEDEGRRYKKFKRCNYYGMMYMDEYFNTELGIQDRVARYITHLSWDKFVALRFPIIGDWILEFLSTVRFTDKRRVRMRHRHRGKDYTFGYPELHNWFGFPVRTTERPPGRDMTSLDVWTSITGQERYIPKLAFNKLISSESILYFHKFLCYSIFGRTNGHKVRYEDLNLLGDVMQGTEVDSSRLLMDGIFLTSRSKNKNIGFGNVICGLIIGGLGNIEVPWTDKEYFPVLDFEFLAKEGLVKRVFRQGARFLPYEDRVLSILTKPTSNGSRFIDLDA
ncbi:hypothetical protein M5689_003000 [Euphorbia peplus]|nr:hypothetical protein M5689_003000 [Euphorbia peplus]